MSRILKYNIHELLYFQLHYHWMRENKGYTDISQPTKKIKSYPDITWRVKTLKKNIILHKKYIYRTNYLVFFLFSKKHTKTAVMDIRSTYLFECYYLINKFITITYLCYQFRITGLINKSF